MKYRTLAICALLFCIIAPQTTDACSAFSLYNGSHFTGFSYDWHLEDGYILVNPRNVKKTAIEVKNPVSWISKYGNCTFNQYGREFPQGGMNEAGLVIEVLWLDETQPADPVDSLKSIDIVQWVQYQLDNSATVADVAATKAKLQITPISPMKLHYYVSDRSGAAMVVEITGKQQHYYPLLNDTTKCITNNTYDDSKRILEKAIAAPSPTDVSSPARLQKLSRLLSQNRSAKRCTVYDVFSIIQSVKQPGYTKWNIVYNQDSCTIHFKTASNQHVQNINFKKIDFTCHSPISGAIIPVSATTDADISFTPFTIDDNRAMMKKSFSSTPGLQGIAANAINGVCAYLESLVCQ